MQVQKIKVASALHELGSIVAEVRQARKLSRADFAKQVGIAEKTVWNIEKGQGFTMESFLLILSYTAMDRPLFNWFKANATVNDLI